MIYNSGDCFYSKTLGKNVMYATGGRFVSVGYSLEMFTKEEVGELDSLVREAHYQAAVETSDRFIDAVRQAGRRGSASELHFDRGWHAALDYISMRVQRHGKKV